MQKSKTAPVSRQLATFRAVIPPNSYGQGQVGKGSVKSENFVKTWVAAQRVFHSIFAWKEFSVKQEPAAKFFQGFFEVDEKHAAATLRKSGSDAVFVA